MNYDRDPNRSCGHKRKYASRTDARAVKRIMTRQVREVFNVYHCDFCGAWHIGHRLPRSMREEQHDAHSEYETHR
jgi:hypothetical protein